LTFKCYHGTGLIIVFYLSTTNVENEVKITIQNTNYIEYILKTHMKYKFGRKKNHYHHTRKEEITTVLRIPDILDNMKAMAPKIP
jgi:predicted secreted acid phosphatase